LATEIRILEFFEFFNSLIPAVSSALWTRSGKTGTATDWLEFTNSRISRMTALRDVPFVIPMEARLERRVVVVAEIKSFNP
jgi:hypothetical protein